MAERCDNCGREGTLTHVADLPVSERPTEIVHGGGGIEETANQAILLVQRCSVCAALTLSTYHWIDGWSDPADYMGFERLHPPRRKLEDLPSRVRARYQSMLELLHAPDAFAVRSGPLLEAVCTDQGVPSGDLGPRLDQLAGKNRQSIPKALAECVRRSARNVKRWSSGEMCLRWTAAGMLEAERQFRRIIGYRDLAKLANAVERDIAQTITPTATEEAVTLVTA